jgi:hypothetical protein
MTTSDERGPFPWHSAVILVFVAVFAAGVFAAQSQGLAEALDEVEELRARLSEAEEIADRAVTNLTGPFEVRAWMFRCLAIPEGE